MMLPRVSPLMAALLLGGAHALAFSVLFLLGAKNSVPGLLLIELPVYLLVIGVRGTAAVLRMPLRQLDTLFGPLFFGIAGSVLYAAVGYLGVRYLRRARQPRTR
jgi:hypothetical protein